MQRAEKKLSEPARRIAALPALRHSAPHPPSPPGGFHK